MAGRTSRRAPRLVPPSVVGGCLRYGVMEVLRFGRAISAQAMQAMSDGAAWHRRFQAEAGVPYRLLAVEQPFRDDQAGVAGRIDAVMEIDAVPTAVEYKTVHQALYHELALSGRPLPAHWAQLLVYLVFAGYPQGVLVVDNREGPGRLAWMIRRAEEPLAEAWVRARVEAIRIYAADRRLPGREVSRACLHCDRWQRCFKTEAERLQAVSAHPQWEPTPPLPEPAAALWPDAIA